MSKSNWLVGLILVWLVYAVINASIIWKMQARIERHENVLVPSAQLSIMHKANMQQLYADVQMLKEANKELEKEILIMRMDSRLKEIKKE